MFEQLSGFFAFLRTRGLRVGVGAELDLGHALEVVGVLDRGRFREAGRATLVKSPQDLALFDEAFDVYWSGRRTERTGIAPARPEVPASPPADRGATSAARPRAPAPVLDRSGTVRVGIYSPDAPPAGHPFAVVDPRRLVALRAGVRRFRRAVATLPGRRLEASRIGRFDFRGTLRHTFRYGGEIVEIHRRRRKRLRSEIVVLWDVSGSMREHDDALLALVYTLHRVSRRTRVFGFSTGLEEITGHLAGRPYPVAARDASRVLGPAGGGTRIGRCLAEFRRRYGRLVHSRTTVLVVSDGWDLGDPVALGRELEYYDQPVVRKVVNESAATDYRWSSVIEGITKSVPFLMKQGRVEQ
ncbi:MAG: VWA domain-containing protein [Candidatus Thermoplasmatota archaeon]